MNLKLGQISSQHKEEFYTQLINLNATRMIPIYLIVAVIEMMIFIGENFLQTETEDIRALMVIKLVFVAMSVFIAIILMLLKKYKCFRILRIFIVLAVTGTLILAITNTLAGQKLVSDISIYIMTLYVITAIVRLSPIYYMIIFSMSFIYFVLGMQIMQPDERYIKWSFMNAIILNIIAVVIARILYGQHVKIYLDKLKIEDQLQALQHMAEYDGLTDIYNHQTISHIISGQKELSRASKASLCLAVIDIDNFKHINDQYGHIVGDQVLVGIAKVIKENVRKHDLVARYGGDEFVILFPGTTLPEACNVCQRILDSMRQVEVSEHVLTGSIGVAELTESNYHNFIEYADAKMYEAKNSGKNRIIS